MLRPARVGTIGGHRVKGVDDRENARADRNLLTRESSRISGTVESLLVTEHDVERRLQKTNVLQHAIAHLRMAPHLFPFVIGQLAGFTKNRVRDADLAHVVENRAPPNPGHLLVVDVHRGRDLDGVLDDAVRVTLRLVVAEVQSGHERLQRRLVGFLELTVQTFDFAVLVDQLLGAQCDQILQVLLVGAVLGEQATLFKGTLDDDLDLVQVERLGDVVARTLPDGPDRDFRVDHARHHDDVELRCEFLDPFEELQAAASRHLHVRQHELHGGSSNRLDGLVDAGCGRGAVAEGLQPVRQNLAHRQLVVDDQHPPIPCSRSTLHSLPPPRVRSVRPSGDHSVRRRDSQPTPGFAPAGLSSPQTSSRPTSGPPPAEPSADGPLPSHGGPDPPRRQR